MLQILKEFLPAVTPLFLYKITIKVVDLRISYLADIPCVPRGLPLCSLWLKKTPEFIDTIQPQWAQRYSTKGAKDF